MMATEVMANHYKSRTLNAKKWWYCMFNTKVCPMVATNESDIRQHVLDSHYINGLPPIDTNGQQSSSAVNGSDTNGTDNDNYIDDEDYYDDVVDEYWKQPSDDNNDSLAAESVSDADSNDQLMASDDNNEDNNVGSDTQDMSQDLTLNQVLTGDNGSHQYSDDQLIAIDGSDDNNKDNNPRSDTQNMSQNLTSNQDLDSNQELRNDNNSHQYSEDNTIIATIESQSSGNHKTVRKSPRKTAPKSDTNGTDNDNYTDDEDYYDSDVDEDWKQSSDDNNNDSSDADSDDQSVLTSDGNDDYNEDNNNAESGTQDVSQELAANQDLSGDNDSHQYSEDNTAVESHPSGRKTVRKSPVKKWPISYVNEDRKASNGQWMPSDDDNEDMNDCHIDRQDLAAQLQLTDSDSEDNPTVESQLVPKRVATNAVRKSTTKASKIGGHHRRRHTYSGQSPADGIYRCRWPNCPKAYQTKQRHMKHEFGHICGFSVVAGDELAGQCGNANLNQYIDEVVKRGVKLYRCLYGDCQFERNKRSCLWVHVHYRHVCPYYLRRNNISGTTHPLGHRPTYTAIRGTTGTTTAIKSFGNSSHNLLNTAARNVISGGTTNGTQQSTVSNRTPIDVKYRPSGNWKSGSDIVINDRISLQTPPAAQVPFKNRYKTGGKPVANTSTTRVTTTSRPQPSASKSPKTPTKQSSKHRLSPAKPSMAKPVSMRSNAKLVAFKKLLRKKWVTIMTRNGQKLYKCQYKPDSCGYKIVNNTKAMTKHVNFVHLKARKYLCKVSGCRYADKPYASKQRLITHLRDHRCGYNIEKGDKIAVECRNDNLFKYRKVIKKGSKTRFKCTVCEFKTRSTASLKDHIHGQHVCPHRESDRSVGRRKIGLNELYLKISANQMDTPSTSGTSVTRFKLPAPKKFKPTISSSAVQALRLKHTKPVAKPNSSRYRSSVSQAIQTSRAPAIQYKSTGNAFIIQKINVKSIDRHLKQDHRSDPNYRGLLSIKCLNKKFYEVLVIDGRKWYRCRWRLSNGLCEYKTPFTTRIARHVNCVHSKTREFRCDEPDCDRIYWNPDALQLHKRNHKSGFGFGSGKDSGDRVTVTRMTKSDQNVAITGRQVTADEMLNDVLIGFNGSGDGPSTSGQSSQTPTTSRATGQHLTSSSFKTRTKSNQNVKYKANPDHQLNETDSDDTVNDMDWKVIKSRQKRRRLSSANTIRQNITDSDTEPDLKCPHKDCGRHYPTKDGLDKHILNHRCGYGIPLDTTSPCSHTMLAKYVVIGTDGRTGYKNFKCCYDYQNCIYWTFNAGDLRQHLHTNHICPYRSLKRTRYNRNTGNPGQQQPVLKRLTPVSTVNAGQQLPPVNIDGQSSIITVCDEPMISTGNQSSMVNSNSQSTIVTIDSQPSMAITDSQPSMAITDSQPSMAISDSQPSLAVSHQRPSTMTTNNELLIADDNDSQSMTVSTSGQPLTQLLTINDDISDNNNNEYPFEDSLDSISDEDLDDGLIDNDFEAIDSPSDWDTDDDLQSNVTNGSNSDERQLDEDFLNVLYGRDQSADTETIMDANCLPIGQLDEDSDDDLYQPQANYKCMADGCGKSFISSKALFVHKLKHLATTTAGATTSTATTNPSVKQLIQQRDPLRLGQSSEVLQELAKQLDRLLKMRPHFRVDSSDGVYRYQCQLCPFKPLSMHSVYRHLRLKHFISIDL